MKKNEIFTYIYFAIISLCKSFNLTNDSKIYVYSYILGTILIIFKIFNEKYTIKELTRMVFLIIICGIIALTGHNLTPLYFAISIISVKNVKMINVFKVILFTKIIGFLSLLFLSSTGIIKNQIFETTRDMIGLSNRYTFGYLHPNITHMHFLTIIILFYYIYKSKTNFITDVIALALNYILYIFTVSRTSFIICSIFIIYQIIQRINSNIDKRLSHIYRHSFLILLVLSIVLSIMWDKSSIVRNLDLILTGRIYYSFFLFKNYSVPLIGGNSYAASVNFDNGYIAIIYQCGLIFSIYLYYLVNKATSKFYIKSEFDRLSIMFFMNLLGFIENIIYTPVVNFSILFLSYAFFEENRGDDSDESNSFNTNI